MPRPFFAVAQSAPASSTYISPCGVCTRCCVEYTVSITGYDVWLIASRLGLAPQQFAICYPVRAEHADGFRLDQTDVFYDIALDKVRVDRPHQPCIFLMELPGGGGRCGIYEHRPQVCQTYPSYLDGDVVALRGDVMCQTGAWNLSQMGLPIWQQRLAHFTVQRDIYSYIVNCWNQRVTHSLVGTRFDVAAYFDFLMNIYQELASCADGYTQVEWRKICDCWQETREMHGNLLFIVDNSLLQGSENSLLNYIERIKQIGSRYLNKPSLTDKNQDGFQASAESNNLPNAVTQGPEENRCAG